MEDLSPNGHVMENMINTTVDQIGRSLDKEEIVAVFHRVLSKNVFGD